MSDRQPKRKVQRSDDVADLFKILRFMASDPDVSEAHFRIAFAISQFVKASTGWAIVGDDALRDRLPRTDGKKLRLFRRAMEGRGWLRIIEGERGRPTRYLFLDARIPEIRKRLDDAAAKRDAEFALSKSRDHSGAKAAALEARIDTETGEIGSELSGEYDPLIESSKAGNLCPNKGAILPPLLPQRSTSTEGYRDEDMTQDAHAHLPASAHVPVRAPIPPPPPMDDFDDTIPEAPIRVRCNCGARADCEVREFRSDRFEPMCEECRDDTIFEELRPLQSENDQPVRMSYADASRGR